MPGWQAIYQQLKDKNFEIISVAQDTGGVKDAGKWITDAHPTYTALIDEKHLVSKLYNMVNVPTGVWIDEKGRIVRPNEVAFADDRFKQFTGMDSARPPAQRRRTAVFFRERPLPRYGRLPRTH